MFTLGGWWGVEWSLKPAWKGCAGSLMTEMSEIYTVDVRTARTSSNTGYCQPRHSPVPETIIRAFHITVNSPLLQSASNKTKV